MFVRFRTNWVLREENRKLQKQLDLTRHANQVLQSLVDGVGKQNKGLLFVINEMSGYKDEECD